MATDIEKNIYRPQGKQNIESVDEEVRDVIVYTTKKNSKTRIDGNAIVLDTDDEKAEDNKVAYAKSIQFKNRKKYYIKSSSGTLINPLGLYTRDIYKKVGDQSAYKWRETNAKAFKFYIGFLKTQNLAYYKNAERSMI